jgi:hypothetical protein
MNAPTARVVPGKWISFAQTVKANLCGDRGAKSGLLPAGRLMLDSIGEKTFSPTVRMSINEQCTLAGRNSLLRPVSVGALAPPNIYGAMVRLS